MSWSLSWYLEEQILPGPSSTERGFPVLSTGSPTVTPAVRIVKVQLGLLYKTLKILDNT